MIPAFSRHALVAVVFLLPPLSLLAPLAAAPALGLVAALTLLPWLWTTRGAPLRALARDPLAWLIAALAVWGAATLLWSPQPLQGAALLPRVVLVALSGLLLARLLASADAATRSAVGRALAAGVGVAALWLVVDMLLLDHALTARLTGHHETPENVPKRGLTLLAILIWPAALWLGRRGPWLAGGAVVLLALLMLPSDAGAAKLALAVGALAGGLALVAPRLTVWAGAGLLSLAILVLPLVLPAAVADLDLLERTGGSAQHRLVIWSFASERALERPLTGWGFNMSRSMPGGDAIDPLTGGEFIPLHPHNAPLQWWMELGLPGALIGAALVLVLAARASAAPGAGRAARAGAIATMAAATTVVLIGYGAWQLWWLSSLALIAGLVAAATAIPPKAPRA